MKRSIKKVAILGSGVMGSRIACHFANIGCEVVLLDIVPPELSEKEKAGGLSLEDKVVRNRIVNDALQFALKSNPSPIYKKSFANRITTGNFDDDMSLIADCDWTIEAVIERLDIKKQVFANVEKYRKEGTLISTNTSGIPVQMMLEGRTEDFQKHFCGTHFFNPPRYLRLLEIIPTPKTDQGIVDFLMDYGARFLGKKMVLCKDTPAFIANRVGVYSIMSLFHLVEEMELTIDEVDKLTGPVLGRPKSATFRTCDVVGLDTLAHVANGVKDNCPDDEAKESFNLPGYISKRCCRPAETQTCTLGAAGRCLRKADLRCQSHRVGDQQLRNRFSYANASAGRGKYQPRAEAHSADVRRRLQGRTPKLLCDSVVACTTAR